MQKVIIYLLLASIILLNVIFITNNGSFLALYYVLWVLIVGGLLWKHRLRVEQWLVGWKLSGFKRFLALGFLMIFFEEIFAGISMHLGSAPSVIHIIIGVGQFLAFNFLTLPGFIIGWYVLLRRFAYSRKEIFVLAGIFGLFAEKTILHVEYPLMVVLLILPTMFTYAIIIAPSVMSFRGASARPASRIMRYALGFVVPFVISIPFVLFLSYCKLHYPEIFPPPGFVG